MPPDPPNQLTFLGGGKRTSREVICPVSTTDLSLPRVPALLALLSFVAPTPAYAGGAFALPPVACTIIIVILVIVVIYLWFTRRR